MFASLALTVANAKRPGRRQTTEMPPRNESALSSQLRNNVELGYKQVFEPSLRTPLPVYTLPLSERVTLTSLGMRRLGQVHNTCSMNEENAIESFASEAVYKPLGYIKYSEVPEKVLKYFLVKTTWMDAKTACVGDGAALYKFYHPVQLDSAMANFYPLLLPWVDIQKARADGGSMLCGYLHGQASGKSSLRWDDCNSMHDFICQKSAPSSTTTSPQYLRGKPTFLSRTTYVTLAEILNAFNIGAQAIYTLAQPAISAALLNPSFTPSQKTDITTTNSQWHYLDFVVMPGIYVMVATNPVLSLGQILQFQTAASDGLAIYNQMLTLSNSLTSQLTPNFTPLLPLLNALGESVTFYTVLSDIVSSSVSQPTVTTEQAAILNSVIAQRQSLYDAAIIPYNNFAASSTTVATTTTLTPIPPLAQIIQSIVTANENLNSDLLPIINVADSSNLTPSVAAQVHALLSLIPTYISTVLPNVVTMLSTNPTLTPAQVQIVKDAVNTGVVIDSNGLCLSSDIATYLGLNHVQSQALLDKMNQGLAMSIGLQDVVNISHNLPTISAAQLYELQTLLGGYLNAITAMENTVTTTTTTVTTPITTTHVLTQAEINTIIVQIQGFMAQITALLQQLLSPAIIVRTTTAQREQPEIVINKLLTLRSRQAEIETLERTMTAHEKKTITSKLDASRDRLRNMVSDRTSFTQYLKFLPGNVQPLTQLLEQTVDILQPFF